MLKRVFKLFLIARRLSTSGAVDIINQVHQIPVPINLFFSFISIGTENNRFENNQKPGEKLCLALQGMGTTFIKLGQFLATRPDIIGDQMAKDLEKLQDKVPAFDLYEAKRVIKKEIGEKQFNNIIEISDPIIIHDPSINPIKPHGLNVVKYDCIVITKLSIRKNIT